MNQHYSAAGDLITYTIVVRNTGNVTLTNILVTDPVTGLNQTISSLGPGSSRSYTTTHTVTQNDLNTGYFDNTARASSTYSGNTLTDSDNVRVNALQNGELTITKSVLETSFTSAGEILHYTITVTNTGNVSLTDVVVSDPNTIVTCAAIPTTMAPDATFSCTAVHTVTADDIAEGRINNTATATGLAPDRSTVTDMSNTVTILLNNLPPAIICPEPIFTNTGATTCFASISNGLSATYSDPNDNIVSLTWVMTGATVAASPSTGINNITSYDFNSGVTTVTYTVTDALGLSASCSFTVTVVDIVPPVITCVPPQDRFTDTDGPVYTTQGTEFDPEVWDNCAISSLTNNYNGLATLAGATFPIGVTSVTWTVTDNSSNTASCSFTVTVTDNVPPVVRCKDITIYLDPVTGLATIVPSDIDNGSFDNTEIATLIASMTNFDCSNLGPNNVTLTVTDIYGNFGSCISVVTVLYTVEPDPEVTSELICSGETTGLTMTNTIPTTTWSWTVNAESQISGASDGTNGSSGYIHQSLTNSDTIVHNVIYSITPQVYGRCELPAITSTVSVNPKPEIRVSRGDTICYGESTRITMRNPNTVIRGRWTYDLIVAPDAGISGNTSSGTDLNATELTENLVNSGTGLSKVVYTFRPRIIPEDGGPACSGPEQTVTIWVLPKIEYTRVVSDFNGFNISCFGKSDGFIRISYPTGSKLNFNWSGPDGYTSTKDYIRGLKPGEYTVIITDENNCSATETIILTEPLELGLTLEPSISSDGAYNINCFGEKTGSISVSAINGVGTLNYIWSDGQVGENATNLSAGAHKVIITDENNCHADSTVTLTQPDPIELSFEIDRPFCPEKPDGEIRMTVTGGVPGAGYNILWSDNSTNMDLTNIPEGTYDVTVMDRNECKVQESLKVESTSDICLIIPGIISPNGDLVNDVWNIGNIELYPSVEIWIYNRWGQFLWKSDLGYPIPWDGTANGRVLVIDSYHYAIDLHNGAKVIVGTITIVK